MSPTEKAVFTGKAKSMGLSLGRLFREAGAAYATVPSVNEADHEVLEAALRQVELSTARTEQALDQALEQVRAALEA